MITPLLMPLSATVATFGLPLPVAAAGPPGTPVHSSSASANDVDVVTVKVHNTTTAPVVCGVWFPSTAAQILTTVSAQAGEVILCAGLPLPGVSTAVYVFSTGSVLVTGDVIRLTQI